MGGSSCDSSFDQPPSAGNETVNIVLVGKTGNGKSATCNSILRERAFESKRTFEGVTTKCQQRKTIFDGRTLNLIDTPGLFDSSHDYEYLAGEIARCVSMAEGGIHAVLIVVTLTHRFTDEERAVVESLQSIFGTKICDYMIVAFTHGDALEKDENPVAGLPDSLKEVLEKCGHRHVLFDNRTKDDGKKSDQIKQLLKLVDDMSKNNGRGPYTNDYFLEYQKLIRERAAALVDGSDEKAKLDEMQNFSSLILSKLMNLETETHKLREELTTAAEKAAKIEKEKRMAEEEFKSAKMSFDDEIRALQERLRNAENRCSIM